MTLSVPEGFPSMSTNPHHLLGVGIRADVPVASEEHVQLDRIE